ncbi:hypothetical protein, partial [Kitasatospora sp. NPDC007106]|uniref:hypothetical protein n=1 Tax=Kitasatospora sp. NPDC007106 TaxID=3156914 RepID=UPI0033C56BB1
MVRARPAKAAAVLQFLDGATGTLTVGAISRPPAGAGKDGGSREVSPETLARSGEFRRGVPPERRYRRTGGATSTASAVPRQPHPPLPQPRE